MWARELAVSPSHVRMVKATERWVTSDERPIKIALSTARRHFTPTRTLEGEGWEGGQRNRQSVYGA
jgi:hypothetical protein